MDGQHRRVEVRSRTRALHDAYTARREKLARAEQQLPCPSDGPVGVVALIGARAVGADVFDQAATLAAYWPRLVRSYALEALAAAPAAPSRDAAQDLLQRSITAERAAFTSPGLGQDVRISGNGVVGAALVWDNVVVHLALFRDEKRASGERTRRSIPRAQRYRRRVENRRGE